MALAEVITAAAAGLVPIGGGIAFVWNKIESRFTSIETKLADAEVRLEECQQREVVSHDRRALLTTVIELLWQEVKRMKPDADVLARVTKLMDDYKAL